MQRLSFRAFGLLRARSSMVQRGISTCVAKLTEEESRAKPVHDEKHHTFVEMRARNADGDHRNRTIATNILWKLRQGQTGTAPRNVIAKKMKDSYHEAHLPLSSNPALLLEYVTAFNTIRVGRILEDLDALAGTIAYLHCEDSAPDVRPLSIVTASVDRIDLLSKLLSDRDYRFSGHVVYVGSSSMDILINVDSIKDGVWRHHMTARFVMVARDGITGKATPVNTLDVATETERSLVRESEQLRALRVSSSRQSLFKAPPTENERLVIHDLYLKTLVNPDDNVPSRKTMGVGVVGTTDTTLTSVRVCQPSERNIHNKIFGGFLLREAFELAWANTFRVCKNTPFFLSLDDCMFRRPVEVGSILVLQSKVIYAPAVHKPSPDGTTIYSVVTSVRADVLDPKTGEAQTTNTFYFTFNVNSQVEVLPSSYSDAMLYLHGARIRQKGLDVARIRNTGFERLY